MKHWPKSTYFGSLLEDLLAGGYKLLAWVTINDRRFSSYYNEIFKETNVSRLFFYAPDRAFIIMFEYTQHEGWKGFEGKKEDNEYIESYWSIKVFLECDELRLVKTAVNLLVFCDNYFVQKPHNITSHSGDIFDTPPGIFRAAGVATYDQNIHSYGPSNLIPIDEIAKPAVALLEGIAKYLLPKFSVLDISSFPPTEYFGPEITPYFWDKFPLRRLNEVAKAVTGV